MSSKRLAVLEAVKALVAAAVAPVPVLGLVGDDAAPDRIGADGRVVIRSGDPGEPEVDLSPIAYNYTHTIPLEITAYASSSRSGEQVVDAMFGAIAAAIEADRHLGGLVDWLDAAAPLTDDDYVEGAAPARSGSATLVATYSTARPL